MPKTPPVVIPVIVDASGVDRGIADANRRLRYGTRGMAGTPSGFGSGGGPLAQGGGGLAGGIAAGAIAGAVAGRVARSGPRGGIYSSALPQGPGQRFPGQVPNPTNNPVLNMWNRAGMRRDAFKNNFLSRQLFAGSQALWGRSVVNYNLNPNTLANTGRYIMGGMGMAGSSILEAGAYAVGRGVRMTSNAVRGVRGALGLGGGAATSGAGRVASRALSLLGLGGRFGALGAAGIPFTIAGGMVGHQDRMRQSFQDLTPFEGTMNYNAARRIRAYYNAPERRQPGFFQEFALGAEMNQTSGGTSLLGAYSTTVSEVLRSMARTAGGLLTSPIDTIMNTFDLESEFQQRNQQAFTNITDEWKRIFY